MMHVDGRRLRDRLQSQMQSLRNNSANRRGGLALENVAGKITFLKEEHLEIPNNHDTVWWQPEIPRLTTFWMLRKIPYK